jgi:hypothetical protein
MNTTRTPSIYHPGRADGRAGALDEVRRTPTRFADNAALRPSLVGTRPYHDDRLRPCHDRLAIHHPAVEGSSVGDPVPTSPRSR